MNIKVDPTQLLQLRQTHTQQQLADVFGCSLNTIKRRLKELRAPKKEGIKPKRKFTSGVRDYLFESYL